METENRPVFHPPIDHDAVTTSVCPGRLSVRRPRKLHGRHLRSGVPVTFAVGVIALVATACSQDAGKPAADRQTTTTTNQPSSTATAPTTTSTTDPSTTTTSAPPASQSTAPPGADSAALLEYASCMQAHGVDLPGHSGQGSSAAGSNGIDPSSPQFIAASKACQHYLPSLGGASASNGPGGS
jgi:hypothetical protein